MHETIKFYVTVRFALSEKLALKTAKQKMAFFVDFALFVRTIDGLWRYGTLKVSDKFALPGRNIDG
jgi:hypothetical protein